MGKENDPTEILKINKHKLDEEWLDQPSLYHIWSDKLARAEDARDIAEDYIDVVKAELDAEVRIDPKSFGITDKVTETAIKAIVITHNKVREAYADYFAKKLDAKILAGAVKALEHRKSALENEVFLWSKG